MQLSSNGPDRASRIEAYDAVYDKPPFWDIGRPQEAFSRLAQGGLVRGRVLDIGCGTGEHALMAAELGLSATGIDVASAAIRLAQRKAKDRQLSARFIAWDAMELPALGETFDTVLDSGMFHQFSPTDRARFEGALRAVMPAGGYYFMLACSDRQPGRWGPRRVRQEEIRATFDDGWQVESIESSAIEVTFSTTGLAAWLATIRRT